MPVTGCLAVVNLVDGRGQQEITSRVELGVERLLQCLVRLQAVAARLRQKVILFVKLERNGVLGLDCGQTCHFFIELIG